MPKKSEVREGKLTWLLEDLLITELSRAGVPQVEIRKIMGCDILRVSRIAKHIKRERTHDAK